MRLKKPVLIFISIFAFLINIVFDVVTEIVRAFAPYKEKERVRKMYPSTKPTGATYTPLWLYALFSRWHVDSKQRGLKIA